MDRGVKEIKELNNKVINRTLLLGILLGGIAYVLSWFNFGKVGFYLNYLTDLIVLVLFTIVYVKRHFISIQNKAIVVIVGIVALVVPDVLKLGLLSDNKLLLIFIPFLAYIGFSVQRSLYLFAGIAILFVVLGVWLIQNDYVGLLDLHEYQNSINPWIMQILIIGIVAFVFVLVIRSFYQVFTQLVRDLRKKNQALAESGRNYKQIFNSSVNSILLMNTDACILDVNDVMLQVFGYSREEISDISLKTLSAPESEFSNDVLDIFVHKVKQEGRVVFEWLCQKKSGNLFWVEIALRRANINNKERLLGIIRDNDEKKKVDIQLQYYKKKLEDLVTERTNELNKTNQELSEINKDLNSKNKELVNAYERLKNAQERMVKSEKLASLGLLSTGVAHELNNPLNFIQGGLVGLEDFFKQNYKVYPEDIKDLLYAIKEGVKRSSSIVESLNHFSRVGYSKNEKYDLHTVITHCLVMLKNKFKGRIKVRKVFAECTAELKGNEGQMHQVFLNILMNAVQSIKEEGEIEVISKVENNSIEVLIKDTGCGMDNQTLSKITEPFFTTKIPGEGTGLGMSITSNIINEHGGDLIIISEQGKGTQVKVTLPIAEVVVC